MFCRCLLQVVAIGRRGTSSMISVPGLVTTPHMASSPPTSSNHTISNTKTSKPPSPRPRPRPHARPSPSSAQNQVSPPMLHPPIPSHSSSPPARACPSGDVACFCSMQTALGNYVDRSTGCRSYFVCGSFGNSYQSCGAGLLFNTAIHACDSAGVNMGMHAERDLQVMPMKCVVD